MAYHKRSIGLSQAQAKRLAKAVKTGSPITFTKYDRKGNVPVYLTEAQVSRVSEGKPLNLGTRQLAHMKAQCGFLGALLKLIGLAAKVLAPAVNVAGPALATGALTGAANYGATKALKAASKGKHGRGLMLNPYKGGFIGTLISTALATL